MNFLRKQNTPPHSERGERLPVSKTIAAVLFRPNFDLAARMNGPGGNPRLFERPPVIYLFSFVATFVVGIDGARS